MMFCRLGDLRSKYVINVRNGCKLGYVDDVEIDTVSAGVNSIVIRGKLRFFGILGREEDIIIPWEDVLPPSREEHKKSGGGFFHILTED